MKYQIRCKKCGKVIGDFATWFQQDQKCACGSTYAEVEYFDLPSFPPQAKNTDNYQEFYFDFLPLVNRDNIVSCGEGMIAIERWEHLEEAAKKAGVD